MKFKELKQMPAEERNKTKAELCKELMKLNAQVATGTTPSNPGRIRMLRKTLAKIKHIGEQK